MTVAAPKKQRPAGHYRPSRWITEGTAVPDEQRKRLDTDYRRQLGIPDGVPLPRVLGNVSHGRSYERVSLPVMANA